MSDMAKQLDDVHGHASSQAATIKALAAERVRYREALEHIRDIARDGFADMPGRRCFEIAAIATEALEDA